MILGQYPSKFKSVTFYLFLMFLAVMLITACGDNRNTASTPVGSKSASAKFFIQWHAEEYFSDENISLQVDNYRIKAISDCASEGVAHIFCNVYAEPDTLLLESDLWSCNQGSGVMQGIPAGAERKFVCLGLDSDDNIIYRGEISGVTILANQTNEVGTLDAFPFETSPISTFQNEVVDPDSVVLQWEAVSGAATYIVQIAENADFTQVVVNQETDRTTFTAAGLSPNSIYFWQVIPKDLHGNEGISFFDEQFTTGNGSDGQSNDSTDTDTGDDTDTQTDDPVENYLPDGTYQWEINEDTQSVSCTTSSGDVTDEIELGEFNVDNYFTVTVSDALLTGTGSNGCGDNVLPVDLSGQLLTQGSNVTFEVTGSGCNADVSSFQYSYQGTVQDGLITGTFHSVESIDNLTIPGTGRVENMTCTVDGTFSADFELDQ